MIADVQKGRALIAAWYNGTVVEIDGGEGGAVLTYDIVYTGGGIPTTPDTNGFEDDLRRLFRKWKEAEPKVLSWRLARYHESLAELLKNAEDRVEFKLLSKVAEENGLNMYLAKMGLRMTGMNRYAAGDEIVDPSKEAILDMYQYVEEEDTSDWRLENFINCFTGNPVLYKTAPRSYLKEFLGLHEDFGEDREDLDLPSDGLYDYDDYYNQAEITHIWHFSFVFLWRQQDDGFVVRNLFDINRSVKKRRATAAEATAAAARSKKVVVDLTDA